MALIKTQDGYRFESTGKVCPSDFIDDINGFLGSEHYTFTHANAYEWQPSERKELAEYMIQRWAEWGGVQDDYGRGFIDGYEEGLYDKENK